MIHFVIGNKDMYTSRQIDKHRYKTKTILYTDT